MYKNVSILAIIPARGGSKGLPGKNIKLLADKPLIAWTIESAKNSKYIDRLIVSSDDEAIIEVAKKFDCDVPFVRPANLAQDSTPSIDVIINAIDRVEHYDFVMMLQPTSPLRTTEDIDSCIEQLMKQKAMCCVSVTEVSQSPYWMYKMDKVNQLKPLLKQDTIIPIRQKLPTTFILNGALYIANIQWLKEKKSFLTTETIGYKMPQARSHDIDDEIDFYICEKVLLKEINKED